MSAPDAKLALSFLLVFHFPCFFLIFLSQKSNKYFVKASNLSISAFTKKRKLILFFMTSFLTLIWFLKTFFLLNSSFWDELWWRIVWLSTLSWLHTPRQSNVHLYIFIRFHFANDGNYVLYECSSWNIFCDKTQLANITQTLDTQNLKSIKLSSSRTSCWNLA